MNKKLCLCLLTVALILSMLALVACGNTMDNGDQDQPSAITVTDQAGREVVIEGEVDAIVSGYYISSSACIALGLEDRMVGIEAKADTRNIYALAAPELIELPNVGSAKDFDLEACIALDPDLVILPLRLADAADTMTELGIPVLLVNPENQDLLEEMISLIAEVTGTKARAKDLIDYYDTALDDIESAIAKTDSRPVVYMAGNSSYLSTAPQDMYQASLIAIAGGTNAASELSGGEWMEVSYEQIIAMNPEVIIVPSEASYSVDDILADAQLAAVTAVKNQAVYQMPTDFEAWDSPVPSAILGCQWLLAVLHDDVYSIDEFKDDAAAFYKEFYGFEMDKELIK